MQRRIQAAADTAFFVVSGNCFAAFFAVFLAKDDHHAILSSAWAIECPGEE
jgi:hypothetical protein